MECRAARGGSTGQNGSGKVILCRRVCPVPRFRNSLPLPILRSATFFAGAAPVALLALFGGSAPLPAQQAATAELRQLPAISLTRLGNVTADRMRLHQLRGDPVPLDYLFRSTSTLNAPSAATDTAGGRQWLLPEARAVWNSALPWSFNDGPARAPKGLNLDLTGGIRGSRGRISVILGPTLIYEQNRDFQVIFTSDDDRRRFANPWHDLPESIDLPLRFGRDARTSVGLGQSSLTITTGPAAVGAATENQWWGPGIRNAIVMSDNAAGFPHLFARTAQPLRTGFGDFAGKLILGWLSESDHFDRRGSNDIRSLSAAVVTFRPRIEPDLTVGIARSVYAPTGGVVGVLGHPLDFLRIVGREDTGVAGDTAADEGPAEIVSLFGRWVFPTSGFEAYAEWARHERPASLRDFLEAPGHSQGYTLGLQAVRPLNADGLLRLQAEVTDLEKSATFRQRPLTSWYTSAAVPQGYTHRGQVIGASIGPGSSSQWLAADYLAPRWQVGVFGGRIRRDDDAYVRVFPFKTSAGHDVSLFAGVRGSLRLDHFDIDARVTSGKRFNYLFQNTSPGFNDLQAVDLSNQTLELTVTPRSR